MNEGHRRARPTRRAPRPMATPRWLKIRRRAWEIEDNGPCFIVRDHSGQALAYLACAAIALAFAASVRADSASADNSAILRSDASCN